MFVLLGLGLLGRFIKHFQSRFQESIPPVHKLRRIVHPGLAATPVPPSKLRLDPYRVFRNPGSIGPPDAVHCLGASGGVPVRAPPGAGGQTDSHADRGTTRGRRGRRGGRGMAILRPIRVKDSGVWLWLWMWDPDLGRTWPNRSYLRFGFGGTGGPGCQFRVQSYRT